MAEKQKILIVDDDASISELISLYLEKEMFDTRCAADGEEALQLFPEYQPNLVILDLMLPGIDGYEVCRRLRASSQVPVIMLSAKGETFDKVLGLELGADDYMVKPFESKELVARVKAVLRRYQQAQAQVNAAVDAALSAQQEKAGTGLTMNGAAGAAAANFAKNGGVGAASPQARMGAGFLDTTGLPAADANGNITFRAYAEGDSGSGELYTYNGQTGQLHRGGTDARTHATDMLDAYRNGDYIEYKDLIVNKSNYAVYYSGHVVEMPPKELELLYFLASSPNQVFTREQLLDHIWGYEFAGDSRTVDVHIKRLREKLPGNPDWEISTVWGIGYKFRVM